MLWSALRCALREVLSHPWRSLLACQGMLWAMVLAIVPAAILEGTRQNAIERAQELGTDRFEIQADPGAVSAEWLQESDVEALSRDLDGLAAISALRIQHARNPLIPGFIWLLGSDEQLCAVRGVEVLEGQYPIWDRDPPALPSPIDVALEQRLASELLGEGPAIGASLLLDLAKRPPSVTVTTIAEDSKVEPVGDGQTRLRVVAVVSDDHDRPVDQFGYEKGKTFSSDVEGLMKSFGITLGRPPWLDQGLGIYVPRSLIERQRIHWIFARCDPASIREISQQAENLLVSRGRSPLLASNVVWSVLTQPELDGYMAIHSILFWLYLAIGMLIMSNILLLSGMLRRREIALRRSEGATRGDVFLQLLGEGLLLSLLGFALGVPTGLALGLLRAWLDPNVLLAITMPWGTAARAFLILMVGALLAASYPAWRGSREAPMVMLRKGHNA